MSYTVLCKDDRGNLTKNEKPSKKTCQKGKDIKNNKIKTEATKSIKKVEKKAKHTRRFLEDKTIFVLPIIRLNWIHSNAKINTQCKLP